MLAMQPDFVAMMLSRFCCYDIVTSMTIIPKTIICKGIAYLYSHSYIPHGPDTLDQDYTGFGLLLIPETKIKIIDAVPPKQWLGQNLYGFQNYPCIL